MRASVLVLFATVGLATAFMSPKNQVKVAKACPPSIALRMSDEETAQAPTPDRPLYDDEVDPTPAKPALSDSMKARLIAEASSGLDSEKKQSNVLLYIMGVIAVLVVLAGQGILY